MRVLIVGEGPEAASIGESLEAAGVAVERRGADSPAAGGSEEVLEIARGLLDLERALSEPRADAVLVVSPSSAALAAIIVATKLGTPVARLELTGDATPEDANARVIRQLADAALAPDPTTIVNWVRGGYSPRA
jgi:UDP-N-acetylglucosamine 2-epimerase